MFKKLIVYAPLFLIGLTTSGASFTMSTEEASTIGGSLVDARMSIFDILTKLAPSLAIVMGVSIVFTMISNKLGGHHSPHPKHPHH